MRKERVSKRRAKSGETITEALVAMLIIGLSSVLFLTMVATSGGIYRRAEEGYKEQYEKISAVDTKNAAIEDNENKAVVENGTITVTGDGASSASAEVNVKWYGDKDNILSYEVG